jgi:hypothetical protein
MRTMIKNISGRNETRNVEQDKQRILAKKGGRDGSRE